MSDRSGSPSPRSRSSSRADTGRDDNSSIPNTSTKSKAQELLERRQASKKSTLKSGGDGAGDSERRRELLKLRQQAREQNTDDEGSNVRASGGSQRPRSPIRQLSRRPPGVDIDEAVKQQQQSRPEDFIDDYTDLTTVDQPKHVFPLSILPVSRTTEITTQPLLIIPAPHPSNIISCINYRPSCTTSNKAAELELLTGDGIVGIVGNDATTELDKLLQKEEKKIDGSFYYGDANAEDGLYTGQLPSMSNVLLSAESLSHQISNVVASSVNLSRVTQRTLREFKSFIEEAKIRQAISTDEYQREAHETIESRHSYAQLLQQLNSTPVFRMIEDPYVDHISQPIIPS